MFLFKKVFYLLFICFLAVSCNTLSFQRIHPVLKKPGMSVKVTKKQLQSKPYVFIKKAKKQVRYRALKAKLVQRLNKLLKQSLPKGIKNNIWLILAKHYTYDKSYKKSLYYYSKVDVSPWKEQASLEMAKIYYQLHKYHKAEQLLSHILVDSFLSTEKKIEAYQMQEVILLKKSPKLSKMLLLKLYSAALKDGVGDTHIYQQKAQQLIFLLKDSDILDLVKEDFIYPVREWIFFRAGKILFYREKFKKSYSVFKKTLKYASQVDLKIRALKYVQAIESRSKVNVYRIGAILPLSGSSASIGKKSLQGLELGLGFYVEPGTKFQLAVLDSRGLQEEARKAVKTLVMQHHVIGIIGGLLSKTAKVIASEAQNFGVPAILLSQKAWITKDKQYIFQNSLSSSLIVNQLVNFLINKLAVKKFALLYPNDRYGIDYANDFWTVVEREGGMVTGAQVYKSGETDFTGPIKRLVGTYYKKDREEEYREALKKWYQQKSYHIKKRIKPPSTLLKPALDFKVLFIPDSEKVISVIASHLAYNDVKDIYLAGPLLWNPNIQMKKNSKYVSKIFFTSTGLKDNSFKKSDFYRTFHQVFDHAPGLFELQAYESALVFRQMIISGVRSRSELKNKLSALGRFHGPIGWLDINKNREFTRSLPIFKIENKKISLVKTHLSVSK